MHGIPSHKAHPICCQWRECYALRVAKARKYIGMAQQPFVWKLCCMRRMINNRIDANTEQTMPLPHSKHWCDLINE